MLQNCESHCRRNEVMCGNRYNAMVGLPVGGRSIICSCVKEGYRQHPARMFKPSSRWYCGEKVSGDAFAAAPLQKLEMNRGSQRRSVPCHCISMVGRLYDYIIGGN
jgi:hypothetical protein